MTLKKYVAIVAIAGASWALGRTLLAEDIVIVPGTISGTVTLGTVPITQLQINAFPQAGGNTTTFFAPVSAGSLSVPYSMTVSVPESGSTNFVVDLFIRSDSNRDFIRPTSAVVSVSSATPGTRDYTLPEPGFISPVFTVTGGATITNANLNATFSASGVFEQSSTNGTPATNFAFPVIPRSNLQLTGSVTLSNGLQIQLPFRTVTVAAGETIEPAYTIDGTATGSIGGTIAFTGSLAPDRMDISASGPQFRSIFQQPPPPDGSYSIGPLLPGNYSLSATARFSNFDDTFSFPNSAYSPGRSQSVGSGQTTINVTANQAFINGTLQLTGASSYLPFINFGSVTVNGSSSQTSGGSSNDRIVTSTRAFDLIVSEGTWRWSTAQVQFFRSAPGLSGSFSYFENRPSALAVEAGEILDQDLTIDLGELAITITAAEGTTFSNPSVNGSCFQRDASNNLLWQSSVNFSTLNLINVTQGTVPVIGPGGTCTLTPRVVVNGQTVSLPNVTLNLVAGTSQTIDVGGPALTITSPAPETIFSFSNISVSGKASDDVAVAGVTVNGLPASIGSSGNPAIPSEINFSRSITLVRGPNVITTVASDTSAPAKTATDTRTVYWDTGAPSLSVTAPVNSFETFASTVTVTGTANDDAGIKKITINGVDTPFTLTGPGNLVSFGGSAALNVGSNTVVVVATDISNRTTTVNRSVTRLQRAPTSLAVAAASGVYGGTATLSATLTSDGAGVASRTIAFSVNGVNATAVTNAAGVATVSGVSIAGLNAGPHAGAVSASFAQDDNYLASSGSAALTIAKASATLTVAGLSHTYDGSAKTASVTTSPADVGTIAITYNGVAAPAVNAGSYKVVATLDSANYEADPVERTLVVAKATATLTLGALSHTYNGTARAATVTTSPGDLGAIAITYDGAIAHPINAGNYAVVATLDNANYEADPAEGTLVIDKATATLTLGALSHTYNGTPKATMVSTSPAGLGTIAITYNGATGQPINAGSYAVVATLDNTNYEAAAAEATLVIDKATATLTLGGLSHTYDGTAKAATVTTSPAGLGTVAITYDGAPAPPISAGSYSVAATLSNDNYHPAATSGVLVIAKAAQTIAFAPLPNRTLGDSAFDVSATASSGLPVSFSASGNCSITGDTVSLTAGGSCTITATQPGNGNYHPAPGIGRAFFIGWTWSNVLPPINVDGSSVFKLNSTVPVKFALTGAGAGVSTLTAKIFLAKAGSGVVGTEMEAVSTSAADSGNTFRYDPTGGQYIFNLGTRALSQGTWQVRIDLGDGSTNIVLLSLKK